MKNTKQSILDEARYLFNEQGFFQVTIRMIAERLRISSGNLNYHFKKREDILQALYFEMVHVFDNRVTQLPTAEISLGYIRGEIQKSMERMIEYRFFWTDMYNLLRVDPIINEHFQAAKTLRLNGYIQLYQLLEKQGLMRSEEFLREYQLLAAKMVNFGNTWLYSAKLHEEPVLNTACEGYANILLSFLYPYLTAKGKAEFQVVLPSFFE